MYGLSSKDGRLSVVCRAPWVNIPTLGFISDMGIPLREKSHKEYIQMRREGSHLVRHLNFMVGMCYPYTSRLLCVMYGRRDIERVEFVSAILDADGKRIATVTHAKQREVPILTHLNRIRSRPSGTYRCYEL
jgi:hypothetical protein